MSTSIPTQEELQKFYENTLHVMAGSFNNTNYRYPFDLLSAASLNLISILGTNVCSRFVPNVKRNTLRVQLGVVGSRSMLGLFSSYMLPTLINTVPDVIKNGRSIHSYPRNNTPVAQTTFVSNLIPSDDLDAEIEIPSILHHKFNQNLHMFRIPLFKIYNNVDNYQVANYSLLYIVEKLTNGPLTGLGIQSFRGSLKIAGLSFRMSSHDGVGYTEIGRVVTDNVLAFDEISPINKNIHGGYKLTLELDSVYTSLRYL